MPEWCRIVKVDGKQVLFTRTRNVEDRSYIAQMVVQEADFFPGGKPEELTFRIVKQRRPFNQNDFNRFATEENARKILRDNMLPMFKHMKERAKG